MPFVPQDVLDRIASLEREVRQLRGRAQMRPALNQVLNGDVVIGEGGQLITKTPEGQRTFIVGQTPQGDWGMAMGRADGTTAFSIGDDINATQQMVRIWSRDAAALDRILVCDDPYSDRFLGRPWIPLQLHPIAQKTTLATYQPAYYGIGPSFNPVARIRVLTLAGTGGGQVRVVMDPASGPAVTVAEWDTPAGAWHDRTVDHPLHGIEFAETINWAVEHRSKTAGQTIETRLYTATGRHCFNASEAPTAPATRT